MPEGPEIELDAVHERAEEAQREGSRDLRVVALTTALLAACAAIASLQAGSTVNEALALKTEATQLQAQASDQWAYYQAKGVKEAIVRASATEWTIAGKTPPSDIATTANKYAQQQVAIAQQAQKLEHERDLRSHEAEHLMHQHHGFASAVAFFQVAIALGAITALTRSRPVFAAAVLLGVIGVVFYAWQYVG